jgi:hypothetical protein
MPNPTFQAIVSAVNQSGAAFRSVRTDLSAVRREADATRGALVKLDRPGMLSSLSGSTRVLGEHFGALNTRVAATGGLLQSLFPVLAGLGAAGSVTELFALVDKVASARAEFIATADKIGVTTGALAGLNYAARMNEVPIDAMQLGLTRLNKTMGAAGLGKGKDAAAILQRLGFSMADVKKGTVTAADVLPKLADSFAHTENAALKTWVATTLFGRGGMTLIPMLNRGGDAIRQFAEEARQLGYVFTAEDNENLEAYHRSMIRLDTAVHGFVNVVGAELAPVLRPIVDDMALWIRANRDWVATGITGAVKDFSDFMKQQDWSGAAHDVGALASGAGELVTALGGLKTVVEGLVLLKLAGWGISAGAGLLKVAAALDAIAGTTIFAALGAWGIVALVAGTGTAATANVLGRIRYGDTLANAKDQHDHPERYPSMVWPKLEQFGPYSGGEPTNPFNAEGTSPIVRPNDGLSLQQRLDRESANVERIIATQEADRERRRIEALPPPPPPYDPRSGPMFDMPGMPALRFPSPYSSPGRNGGLMPDIGVEGRLRIFLDIPNLPPGTQVRTETDGNVPHPEVNVGHSDPLAPF